MKRCIVCTNPMRKTIERDILDGLLRSLIADRYGVPPQDLRRHAEELEAVSLDDAGMAVIYRTADAIEEMERFAAEGSRRGLHVAARSLELRAQAFERILAKITKGRSTQRRREAA